MLQPSQRTAEPTHDMNTPAVWHLRCLWHHDFTDEPAQILSEIGEDRYEARKVEVFRDGRLDWADESRWSPSTMLGEVPVPPLEEINDQEEFTATVISAEEFEQAWTAARGASRSAWCTRCAPEQAVSHGGSRESTGGELRAFSLRSCRSGRS